MKRVLTFPSYFFFGVVAPLVLEELDGFTPCDMILLVQDFDRMLGVRQVSLEWCHFRQHDIHMCFQSFLQLQHMENVITPTKDGGRSSL
jgi:hypothetical protein